MEVLLSRTEARIVKNTLNKTAQVFVKAQRTKSIMIGYSGSYGINGKQICLYSPLKGNGMKRNVGRDGSGRPIYSVLSEFTLQ